MKHRCHALACKAECPPRWLMCRDCWRLVPAEMQKEVNRTVGMRARDCVDATWASWWRAQALAIHHVAMLCDPSPKGDQWLAHQMTVADRLESKE